MRRCADVCKINHLLRSNGVFIRSELLDDFDASVARHLQLILDGNLDEEAKIQATVGVKDGGLGLQRAADMHLPAFIAASLAVRPMIVGMTDCRHARILPERTIEVFDADFSNASELLMRKLSPTGISSARRAIGSARTDAEDCYTALKSGKRLQSRTQHSSDCSILLPVGAEDPEYPDGQPGNLQKILGTIINEERMDLLSDRFTAQHRWTDARRLRELRDPSVSHDWI